MKVLSILWAECSTATLMVDGEIVACVSEERFSRKKNDERYPKQSIEYVLAEGGVKPEELDIVAFAGEVWSPRYILTRRWSTFSVQDRLREQHEYWYPVMYLGKNLFYYDLFGDKLDLAQYPGRWEAIIDFEKNNKDPYSANGIAYYQDFRRQVVAQHLGVAPNKIQFIHHHRAHAYYAYYASPLPKDRVVILTADAWGDDMNASVSLAEGGQIRVLHTSANFMLARFYRSMTLLLGMKPDEHEYKVMGLAAYAKPDYYQGPLKIFKDTQYVDRLGFAYNKQPPDLYVYFRDLLEGYRFDSIAGALQRYTEDILAEWTRNAIAITDARRVAFGGGIAMNVKAMMELTKLPEVEDIFICPTPSDESIAPGAAYAAMHEICIKRGQNPVQVLKPFTHSYWGPPVSRGEIQSIVARASQNEKYVVSENPKDEYIAQRLAEGKLVGRCVGRSEFGARALGNRSILADPRDTRVIKAINESVKNRDFWMPFAPTVLEENEREYLVNPKSIKAPYMTIAFETTPLGAMCLKAGLHQADFTCRPQILSREQNPEYHALICAFRDQTGVAAVLNTSFNFHGEPIIQTAHDAMRVFENSNMDMLLLDGILIEKR